MRILFLLFASIGMAIRGQRRKKRQEEQFQQQQQLQQQQFHHEQMMQQQQFQYQMQQQQMQQQQFFHQQQHGAGQIDPNFQQSHFQQQQHFQAQLEHQQHPQPLLQDTRDMNGSPLHYNSQMPSQYNNMPADINMNHSHTPVQNNAIHRVTVPDHQPQQIQYGSDIKQQPEMAFTGGFNQPPQYVKA